MRVGKHLITIAIKGLPISLLPVNHTDSDVGHSKQNTACRFASLPDYCSFRFSPTSRISNSTDLTKLLMFTGMKPGVLRCCVLFPKCAKTHLRASAITENFPGVVSLDPR